ncbi:hypothetical protein TPHV1_240024 [Treponema phagedenis]|uniref:Uncharacterized protein n=1 Tax=Treponema phagedenis TaxID=162 RepID=A0A0B7GTK8_TREPH|nr:hypothetical protein TPHV1_240024 [Treponema phagedenis]
MELSNGEQFTIVMLNPVSFTNTFALKHPAAWNHRHALIFSILD